MQLHNLTYDERRRFHKLQVCPICRAMIEEFDSFEPVSFRYGRNKIYTFIHTSCLLKFHTLVFHEAFPEGGENDGKENGES